MDKLTLKSFIKRFSSGYTIRLLLVLLTAVIFALFATDRSISTIINKVLLQEKEEMLFGLTHQLDNALKGTYNDILVEYGAIDFTREDKIKILNNELESITDLIASGIDGVGAGYYSKELDAIITYGPEKDFAHTIGQPIFEGHLGYEVMETGKPLVQQGDLVRGKILNCMLPIIRDGQTIGYIWANETLKDVSSRLSAVSNQILILTFVIFIVLYIAVMITTWHFNSKVDLLIDSIQVVMRNPRSRLAEMQGPLASVVEGVNNLLDKAFFFKSNNEYIFDGVLSGILAISVEGEILLANTTFRKMFEISEDGLIGGRYKEIFPEILISVISQGMNCLKKEYPSDIIYKGCIIEYFYNDVYNNDNEQIG
ncbi:MAG: hypothetical protein PQJ46_09625, partial [Spirochaetales bacterium]|nr:hypothetical protein [Spirochaetales bacterium]